jgi:hypothetical protein
MKWTAPAALLATTLLAGTGKAQDFHYRNSPNWRVATGSSDTGTGLGGSLLGLTGYGNSPFGGFGVMGFSTSGYRLNGTFNTHARAGGGTFGPFGTTSTFGRGGFGSGALFANMMPQIHQHGPLFNYGPYYGYPPFEPYGPWDAYLRFHQPMALVADSHGSHPWGRGNPHPLCGSLCKRRTAASDGCAAATEVAGGGLKAARSHEGWGLASGGCCKKAKATTTDACCGTVASAHVDCVPVLSRYAGCGSPEASGAYYQGSSLPTVTVTAPATTLPKDMPKPEVKPEAPKK